MSNIAIRVESLSKKYFIGAKQEAYETLRDGVAEALGAPFRRIIKLLRGQTMESEDPTETIWALTDLSFEVRHGEVIGVIGRNGAGKSTLLKILSRITEPTGGYADIYGRVGSLLEVGTGFHAELTGRENIYLNGAILGMKKTEIDRKFDEIVAFSGIDKFIDTPVKRYSSGMYLRLAFAVAAHLEPEVLIVDEVLAVGDADFQKKCLAKMGDVAKEGRTVLLVSHNMRAITQLCERSLWLEDGRLKLDGPSSTVVSAYLSTGTQNLSFWVNPSYSPGLSEFQVKQVRLLSLHNQLVSDISFHSAFKMELTYEAMQPIKGLALICRLTDSQGTVVWTSWDTDGDGWNGTHVTPAGSYLSTCKLPARLLRPGRYFISIGACSSKERFDYHENVLAFDISEFGYPLNSGRMGVVTPILEWNTRQLQSEERVA